MSRNQRAWLVTGAAYIAGVAVALNQTKVPPVMQVLIDQLHIDTVTGGWLMSSFAIAGILLALPAAMMLERLGPKRAGLIALGCTMLGSTFGALAANAALLLVGRVVEGIGLGLIIVVSPAVISMWFPPEQRGLPMGIWATWMPVGSFTIYNLSGVLLPFFGWQGVWWFGVLFAFVAFILYAFCVTSPEAAPPGRASATGPRELTRVVLYPPMLVLAGVFAAYTLGFAGFGTWAPTYFADALGIAPAAARLDASLSSLAVIPSLIVAGWVLNRIKKRELVLALSLLVVGALMAWAFRLGDTGTVVPYMLALGTAAGFIPTTVFTLAPEMAPRSGPAGAPQQIGVALGMVSIGQNLGMFIGPPLIGWVIAQGHWEMGNVPLMLTMALGAAASLLLVSWRMGARQPSPESPVA